jgi:hypothetical protein
LLSPRLSRALAARGAIACLLGLAALGPGVACAADPPPARAGATPVAPTPGSPDSALSIEVARTGLEGSAASRARKSIGVTYENRRYREPAIALGHVARVARESDQPPDSIWGIERRLGLPSAAMPFRVGQAPDRVIYPGESSFPPPPAGRRWGSTERSLDLVLTPLITYELGRIYEPVLLRVEIAPELRINPWPGARARASVIIPLHNDFTPDELSPDIGRVRPGV